MTPAQAITNKLPVSESTKRANPQLFVNVVVPQCAPPKKRIRQSSKPLMNKLETEWLRELEVGGVRRIRPQAITFRLANGLRFTPDFTGWQGDDLVAWEVKGPYAREDSLVKLKVAAATYPDVIWRLVWKDEQKQWCSQEVKG